MSPDLNAVATALLIGGTIVGLSCIAVIGFYVRQKLNTVNREQKEHVDTTLGNRQALMAC